MAPELDPCTLAAEALQADAIHGGDPAAVRNRMTALNRLPRVELLLAVLRFLRRMPADGSRIEQDIGTLQRGEAGGLGIPLILADQRADRPDFRVEGAKA